MEMRLCFRADRRRMSLVSDGKGFRGPGLRVSEADLLPGTAGAPVSPSHCSDEG